MAPTPSPSESPLFQPIETVPEVGPRRAVLFEKLDVRTVADLLFFFPRDYEDLAAGVLVEDLEEGKLHSVCATVEQFQQRRTFGGKTVTEMLFSDTEGTQFKGVWFYRFFGDRWQRGDRVLVTATPKKNGPAWQMVHPTLTRLAEDETPPQEEMVLPVYRLTEGLRQWEIRRAVRHLVEKQTDALVEVFPEAYLASHDLLPIREALPNVHFPPDHETLDAARRRFIYQELFILQLALVLRARSLAEHHQSPRLETTPKIDARIRRLFPFEPTDDQERAIGQIVDDLKRTVPMNRLLQGDVGTGKTAVAAYAMLVTVAHGYQATLMAPTEVLARQHFLTLQNLLAESRVRLALLTGGMGTRERRDLLERLAQGEIDLLVGTQAVIQEDVEFARLGLVVIDEQHKFGVQQRAKLREASADKTAPDPHYLVMTATPIPRTVTMTLFGDLDLSLLRQAPPGRQKVNTYLVTEDLRERWWTFFSEKLREGRQGYVVVPLVEESEELDATSLEEAYEELVNGPLEPFRVGLIHGRMTSDEKDAIMDRFRRGKLQVLVSTSVIEVGVDIPGATLMTIESGQRFGLASLHQLRGRIVRGKYPGFCGVFADVKTDESLERIEAFVKTTDGFELAEVDFRLRGPGELFGTRQHGLPPFHLADLLRDEPVLIEARDDARALVDADPGLASAEHARLREMVLKRYGRVLDLGDVG